MVQRSPDALPCTRVREDIDARLSGRLHAARNAAVDAHLQRCPACRAELELAAAVRRELSALPRFEAPPRVIEAIRRQAGSAPSSSALPFSRSAGRRLPAGAALAAAAAVALAVAAIVFLPDRSPQPPQVSAAQAARATAEARLAFALVAGAAATAQDELRHGVLRDRVMAPALRGLSRSVHGRNRHDGTDDRHTTRTTIPGGSS